MSREHGIPENLAHRQPRTQALPSPEREEPGYEVGAQSGHALQRDDIHSFFSKLRTSKI